jgi:4-diphosphocytidyl-2-C-methyl-D-erythritol kinase
LPRGFLVREPKADDLPGLHALEARAAKLFARHGFPEVAETPSPRDDFAGFVSSNTAVVAADGDGRLLGFAVAGEIGGIYWLKELSVEPDVMRRGIGTALLNAIIERAGWAFHTAIGLSTFRDVPFNAPFYARRGFLAVDPDAVPEAIRRQFEREVPAGAEIGDRVLMIRKL